MSVNQDSVDYSKMKVNDLKKLLKARCLPTAGNKQELLERLQSSEAAAEALLEGSEAGDAFDEDLERELDESALDDEPAVKETKKEEKSPTKMDPKPKSDESETKLNGSTGGSKTSENSVSNDKKEERKITITNLSISEAERKKKRAERFGAAAIKSAETKVGTTDAMKRRAERFGILGPVEAKRQHLEKLQARKARFSASTPAPAPITIKPTTPAALGSSAASLEEKKRLRAERFKMKA